MNRRYFLMSMGTLGLGQMISGCQTSPNQTLKVRLLKNSIPTQLLAEFRRGLKGIKLDFVPEGQLKDTYSNLETWHQSPQKDSQNWFKLPIFTSQTPEIADLITLGDYWLTKAIREKMIQPLDAQYLSEWSKLPPRWQELVRRNSQGKIDPQGQVWAAPYRWGTTVIAYRRDKFKSLKIPTDWADLWQEGLEDKISLLDQPREVIGLTLKKLGYSYNTLDLNKVPELKDNLKKLQRQVKFYNSENYLQPLLLGDTYLAVGWSTDVLRVMKRNPEIGAIIPESGTAIWTDLWVSPTNPHRAKETTQLLNKWIDFCWGEKIASQISLFTQATSPIVNNIKLTDLPQKLANNSLLLPKDQVLKNSEFLDYLPPSTVSQYLALWQEIRKNG